MLLNATFIEYLLWYKALGYKEGQEIVSLKEFIFKLGRASKN